MPDVFKLLKDLEAKAAGLEPGTNKPQEGYFVAFRNVGLPIHKEDFENPWSPLGTNLAKAIPQSKPADPANAPKTASGQIDDSKVYAANIAKSQQAYLNTFLLTDDKLRLSNEYSVMPGSSKVSDSWYAVITGANGIPVESVLKPEMQAAYDKARAKLMDAEGNPTARYQAYLQYEDQYKDKVKAWHRAYAAAFTDPMKLQNWPIEGTIYHDEADEAMDRWVGFGFKEEIENALATLAAQGTDPAIALIARAKKRFINSLNEFQNIGQIPYTVMLPNSWYDPDDDEGWEGYSSTDFHSESQYEASSTSIGGGAAFNIGLWHGGGSFNHTEQQSAGAAQVDGLDITFKYAVVDIKRPWLDTSLLNLKNWFLMGDYEKGCISKGTMAQELPDNGSEPTFLPSIVTSLILVKDLSIKWTNWQSDWQAHEETNSGSAVVGYGPFAIGGTYSHHDEKRSFEVDATGESLVSSGIQLVGYVSTINPSSPVRSSSEFLEQAETEKAA